MRTQNQTIANRLANYEQSEVARWAEELKRGPERITRLKSADFPTHLDNLVGPVQDCTRGCYTPDLELVEALCAHPDVRAVKEVSDFEFLDVTFREEQTREQALAVLSGTLHKVYGQVFERLLPEKEAQFSRELDGYDEILAPEPVKAQASLSGGSPGRGPLRAGLKRPRTASPGRSKTIVSGPMGFPEVS